MPSFVLEAGLQPWSILGGILTTLAVTFLYAWLLARTKAERDDRRQYPLRLRNSPIYALG